VAAAVASAWAAAPSSLALGFVVRERVVPRVRVRPLADAADPSDGAGAASCASPDAAVASAFVADFVAPLERRLVADLVVFDAPS
jgi:hypothetical protein